MQRPNLVLADTHAILTLLVLSDEGLAEVLLVRVLVSNIGIYVAFVPGRHQSHIVLRRMQV